jgi:hypothetical protein
MSQRPDGKLNDGVYVSYQIRSSTREIIRMWIGTCQSGPVLQWDADGVGKWDGLKRCDFAGGAWAICYSHGNYGHNCACGGTWSSHTIDVAGLPPKTRTEKTNCVLCEADAQSTLVAVPRGIQHDLSVTEIEPKDSWAIWFAKASDALDARLTPEQIQSAPLPRKARELLRGEDLTALKEVLTARKL